MLRSSFHIGSTKNSGKKIENALSSSVHYQSNSDAFGKYLKTNMKVDSIGDYNEMKVSNRNQQRETYSTMVSPKPSKTRELMQNNNSISKDYTPIL